MPLPISHSLAGATLFAGLDRAPGVRAWPRLLAAVVLANAPDLDLVPGILMGDPNRFHHGATHSLFTALFVGLVAGGVAWAAGRPWPTRWKGAGALLGTAAMVAALWGSHVVLDAVTHDPSPPQGVPMFWPVSDARVSGPAIFWRADKVAGPASPTQFAASLLSAHNAMAVGREVLLTLPVLLIVWRWRRRDAGGGES